MFRRAFTTLALVALVVALVASSGAAGLQTAKAQGKTYKIALSVPALSFPFFVIMAKQVQDHAKQLGNVTVDVLDGQNKTDKQTADLESVIASKYDGLIVSPLTTDSMEPAIKEVADAKIPIVTVDRNINNGATLTLGHVGADNVMGGQEQGWYIMKQFPKGATLFNLTGTPGSSPAIDRAKGLHMVLDPHPEYKIVAEQTGQFTRDEGNKVAEALLSAQANPPDVINAANDDMALGVIEVLRAKNLNGKVAVIGFDAITESLQAIQTGDQTADIDQFPGAQSSTALDLLLAFLDKGTKPAQHDTFLPPVLIDKNNLPCAAFYGDMLTAMKATPDATPIDPALCKPLTAPSGTTGGAPKGRIVFIPKSTDVSYWLWVKKGVEDRAKELGYTTDYQGVAREIDIAQQVDLVKNVAASKPAGIIMAATDAKALVPPVEAAIQAGIPLVTVDSGVDSDAPLAYYATDNVAGAAEGAKILAKLVGDKGKVGDLGILAGSVTGREREQGFVDEITKNHPNMKVVPVQFTGCDPAKALNAATDILTANPDIVGFYSACGPNGLGIAQAVKAKGLQGKVAIVTFDPNPEVIPLFKDGTITAMISQDPYQMGYKGVDAIDAAINKKPITDKKVLIPVTIITKENFDDPKIQQLITPPQ